MSVPVHVLNDVFAMLTIIFRVANCWVTCVRASTGFPSHSASSSSCVCWHTVQGSAWTGTVVHRRPLSTSHDRRWQTETPIRYSWRPRCLRLCHAVWHPCICCGGS